LDPAELGQQAQSFDYPIPLKDILEVEIAEIDKRKIEENKAIEEMEKKRAEEKERGRREIIERVNVETIHESGTLPVYTRTPRMLITGKIIAGRKSALCTNGSKYLHQQRSGIS
jgi:hypothetical protein